MISTVSVVTNEPNLEIVLHSLICGLMELQEPTRREQNFKLFIFMARGRNTFVLAKGPMLPFHHFICLFYIFIRMWYVHHTEFVLRRLYVHMFCF